MGRLLGIDPGTKRCGVAVTNSQRTMAFPRDALAHDDALLELMRALPWHAARGQCYLPLDVLRRHGATRDHVVSGVTTPALLESLDELRTMARQHLRAARANLRTVIPEAAPAFLPLALIEPYLARMETRGYDPFRTQVALPQWRRQWALWRASRA